MIKFSSFSSERSNSLRLIYIHRLKHQVPGELAEEQLRSHLLTIFETVGSHQHQVGAVNDALNSFLNPQHETLGSVTDAAAETNAAANESLLSRGSESSTIIVVAGEFID